MLKQFPNIKIMSFACRFFCLLMLNIQFADASTKTTVSSGNWNDPSIWNPAGVPASTDNVTIASGNAVTVSSNQAVHTTTVSSGGTLTWSTSNTLTISGVFTVNGIVTMNGGNITLSLPGTSFVLGANSSFTWQPGNNTSSGATLFTNGSENFSPSSTLIIKKWYNYTVPIGSLITGNFGNLTLNSQAVGNTIVEWNQNNTFQTHQVAGTLTIDQGWITLDKSSSITNTTIGNVVLTSMNSTFYCHNGTHSSSFIFNTTSVTNTGGIFYGLNDGNGNVTVNINGNFTNLGNVKIINNSGVSGVSNGNATFNVIGTFAQSIGDTRIIYNVTTLNSGTYSASFGNVNLTGGIFMGQTACHTAGGLSTFSVLNNLIVNFSSAADKFRCTSLSSIGSTLNNVRLNMTVGGNLSINGTAASEFTSAASKGNETITITGNILINGSTTNFNYGTTAAAHNITLNIGGDILINDGTTFLSRNGGSAGISVSGNVSITSGNLSVKGDTGIAAITINGSFNQSGGSYYLHNNTPTPTTNNISMTVNGDFTQSAGIINFDNNNSSLSATHIINIAGPTYTLSGTGLITHAGAGTNTIFGQLNFTRNGAINFNRTSNTHFIQQVKQTVSQGCTLNITSGNIQVTSHTNSSTDYFRIATGGIVSAQNGQLASNAMSSNCGMQIDSGGTLKTYRTRGLYDGTPNACINASNNFNFYLHAYSVVEYNGTDNQTVTGIGARVATTINHKYGILRINFNGTDNIESVSPSSSNVFIRTRLEMIHGELNLNGYTVTVESGIPSAITRSNGYIKSEMNSANNTSILTWKNLTAGLHVFPFGVESTSYIPVDFTPTAGFGGDVSISTRATAGSDNQPYPATTSSPSISMVENGNDISSDFVIDRWWNISANGFTADVALTYRGVENTLTTGNNIGAMGIIQWTGTGWSQPVGSGTGTTANTGRVSATGITLFSQWLIMSHSNPLPIELTSFNVKGEGNQVRISWTTATEINNDHFNIERSMDGFNFESIQQMIGAGNSNVTLNYSTVDKHPIEGTSYYRLKQTDYDGRFSYSDIKSVNISSMFSDNISIDDFGPNPFDNNFWITYRVGKKGTVNLQLTSGNGQLIHSDQMNAEEGSNRYEFTDEKGLNPGIYFLNIIYNDKKVTQKLIKK